MADFTDIDESLPAGTQKVKDIDDAERETRAWAKASLSLISGYPNTATPRVQMGNDEDRPTEGTLAGLIRYNTTSGLEINLGEDGWASAILNTVLISAIQGVVNAVVPVGSIIEWSGSVDSVPSSDYATWQLCNGTNGTIDLRGKFVLGAGGDYSVGNTGGEEEHTLTIDEMPAHTHEITPFDAQKEYDGPNNEYAWDSRGTGSVETSSVGGGEAHNNMPPYYALCYIQRIA